MRVIVAGSRVIYDYDIVYDAIKKSGFEITELVSGTARGVDRLGEFWALHHDIPVKKFPADWGGLGKRAGYLRNEQMADYADALIAVWDGKSKGTKHMIDVATVKELKVFTFHAS